MTLVMIIFSVLTIALVAVGILLLAPIKKTAALLKDPEDFEHVMAIDNFEIFYQDAGRGDPIIFLHGLGASSFVWRYQLNELSEDRRVIVPDLPGFGRSSKLTSENYDLDSQIERLSQFVERLSLDRFALAGSSMGGLLALALANRLQNKVSKLILMAPATDSRVVPPGVSKLGWTSHLVWPVVNERLVARIMKSVNANPRMVTEDTIREASRHFNSKDSIVTFLKATKTLRHRSIRELPAAVFTPTLVLYGQKDKVIPRKVIDSLVKRLPDGKLAVHTEAGHHIQEDEHEWTNQKIREFLGST